MRPPPRPGCRRRRFRWPTPSTKQSPTGRRSSSASRRWRSGPAACSGSAAVFDWKLLLKPNCEYNNLALDPSARQGESDRRLKFAIIAAAFGSINRTLLEQINSLQPRPPRCPLDFAQLRDITRLNVDQFAFKIRDIPILKNTFFTLGGSGGRATAASFKSACSTLDQGSTVSNTVANALDDPSNNVFRRMFGLATGRQSVRELLTGAGLQEAIVTLEQAPHEILGVTQQFAQAASAQAILALHRLGVVPLDTVIKTAKLDVRLTRLLRNGITFGTGMFFNNSVDNFKDKSLDPFYGGSRQAVLLPRQRDGRRDGSAAAFARARHDRQRTGGAAVAQR